MHCFRPKLLSSALFLDPNKWSTFTMASFPICYCPFCTVLRCISGFKNLEVFIGQFPLPVAPCNNYNRNVKKSQLFFFSLGICYLGKKDFLLIFIKAAASPNFLGTKVNRKKIFLNKPNQDHCLKRLLRNKDSIWSERNKCLLKLKLNPLRGGVSRYLSFSQSTSCASKDLGGLISCWPPLAKK